MLIVLPFLALSVVISVYRGKRKFEPAFLSWIAALLFATIPIRNFLPGTPPAGSWVDVTEVVWVVIALVIALFFGVGSWWRMAGREPDLSAQPHIQQSLPAAELQAAGSNAAGSGIPGHPAGTQALQAPMTRDPPPGDRGNPSSLVD